VRIAMPSDSAPADLRTIPLPLRRPVDAIMAARRADSFGKRSIKAASKDFAKRAKSSTNGSSLAPDSRLRLRIYLFFDLLVFPVDAAESGSRSLFTNTSVSF
jgi:hypothetical protein